MAAAARSEDIVTFTNGRGQKLRRWSLPGVESPRALCVTAHGVGDHIAAYAGIAQVLWDKQQISLCGFDLVGHGRSEGARVDIIDFQHYVDDLIQYVDIVKSENPQIPVFAMGHSMGGLVVAQALLRKPDLVEGAVLYAAAFHAHPSIATPFKITMAKVISRVFPSFPVGGIGDELLTHNKEELERLKVDPLRHHGKMKARWGLNTLTALIDFNNRMSEVTLPVLIAHGGDDQVCHIDGSKKFHENTSSTDKTFKVYEKGYHRLHTEPDGIGEQFINDVADWLNNRIKSSD